MTGDYLPLSALQHLLFCERQMALIHVERVWAENRLTAEGRVIHERAHTGGASYATTMKVARGLHLVSETHRLQGIADIVELHKNGAIVPVEYKRGRPKKDLSDKVQLCAQALCLEEMMGKPVPLGLLFYGQTHRRLEVHIDDVLRTATINAINRLHEIIGARLTPPAFYDKRCESCSLLDLCMPNAMRLAKGVSAFNQRQFQKSLSL